MSLDSSGWDLVVSFGDLSRASGYRTRVLGELEHLDRASGFDPFLLLFDRRPAEFSLEGVPFNALRRSSPLRFYSEIAKLSRQKPIRVVHAHNLYSAALALPARRKYGYRVILDYHGRIPEEYVFLGKGGRVSRRCLEALESWSVRQSDHVVAVSNKLAEYLADRYPAAKSRISVIPCATDSTLFRCDARLRADTRARLGLDGKFVCIHLGSFFEWYEPELLVRVFRQIQDSYANAHLLFVTPETGKVGDYAASYWPKGSFTVTSAEHGDVPGLLNAADVGFLLLRAAPNIRTSSPVKFAEYLNCGLPVVITPEVGDFSGMVSRERVGMVLDSGAPLDISLLRTPREELAARCVAAGASLTWSASMDTWRSVLNHACVSVAR